MARAPRIPAPKKNAAAQAPRPNPPDVPATFASTWHVQRTGGVVKFAFGEPASNGAGIRYHTAAAMNVGDAIEMAQRLLALFATQPAEPAQPAA